MSGPGGPTEDRPDPPPEDLRRGPRLHSHRHDRSGAEWDRFRGSHRPWRDPYRQRPGWWPADEPWPPQGEFPWRRVRRLFFIRFAIVIFLLFVLVIAGPIIALAQILNALGLPRPGGAASAVAFLAILFLAIAGTAGSARRFALNLGGLIEAAGRLEAGDYSARVSEHGHGPRELRSLVRAFNAMAARLEEDERQRRTLLADVSHELRTPLAVLQGELEAMIDGIHPTDEAHLAAAVDEIRMLTGLVEDLRTLALAEAGTLPLHPETTDLSVLAQEVAASFEALASQSKVRLRVDAADDLPLLELDPLRVRQVLGNLVANALRYAPAGSEVLIEARRGADRVLLSIVDHGPGISPEVLPHLFDRFAKSAESRGSGLGLAIARRLVEAHGGTIRAERPVDGGTAIRFELPIPSAG